MRTSRMLIILWLSLTLAIYAGMIRCEGQLQWQTYVQIDLRSDGSATWIVQQTTVLTNEDDEAAFYQYLNITYADRISEQVNSMIDNAALITGRSMRVENLEVNANISSKGLVREGIVQYHFDWIGFAEKTDSNISVGDVFSGEIDFSWNDALSITYPSGYVPEFVYPSPNGKPESKMTLTWIGQWNFGAGEPRIMFVRQDTSWADAITSNITGLAMIITAISAGLVGYLGIRRFHLTERLKPYFGENDVQSSATGIENDEEKVLRILHASKGSVLQSVIAKQCGFSKSKASELLSAMEIKGVVHRKKMGREKSVLLVEGKKDQLDTILDWRVRRT